MLFLLIHKKADPLETKEKSRTEREGVRVLAGYSYQVLIFTIGLPVSVIVTARDKIKHVGVCVCLTVLRHRVPHSGIHWTLAMFQEDARQEEQLTRRRTEAGRFGEIKKPRSGFPGRGFVCFNQAIIS